MTKALLFLIVPFLLISCKPEVKSSDRIIKLHYGEKFVNIIYTQGWSGVVTRPAEPGEKASTYTVRWTAGGGNLMDTDKTIIIEDF